MKGFVDFGNAAAVADGDDAGVAERPGGMRGCVGVGGVERGPGGDGEGAAVTARVGVDDLWVVQDGGVPVGGQQAAHSPTSAGPGVWAGVLAAVDAHARTSPTLSVQGWPAGSRAVTSVV